MNRRLSLCRVCGQHVRGTNCEHPVLSAPRSRSALIASALGLTALGAGCSGPQEPVTPADEAQEVAPTDSLIAAPPTEVDPQEILISPEMPPSQVFVPLYGVAPMPEPVPEERPEGSGEGDEAAEDEEPLVDEHLQEELENLVPQPVYGVPPMER